MVWSGRHLKDHIVPTHPHHGHRKLSLDQAAHSPTQSGLEHCQGSGAYKTPLGNLYQWLITLWVKNFFLIPSLNLLSFNWKPEPCIKIHQCQHPKLRQLQSQTQYEYKLQEGPTKSLKEEFDFSDKYKKSQCLKLACRIGLKL